MSVVGVKMPLPVLPPQQQQQLRSQLSAALPLQALQGSSGGGSAGSSPGSEVMRAHSTLEELSSPKRLG